jgi:hypothetical protein
MANVEMYDQGKSITKKSQIYCTPSSTIHNFLKPLIFEQICEDIMYSLKMYAFTVYFAVQK